jgi:hypothetical protein
MILLKTGNTPEVPTKEYYLESEAEFDEIPKNAPIGSTALILTEAGLTVKMKNSKGQWIAI